MKSAKSLRFLIVSVLSLLAIYTSCKKNEPANVPKSDTRLIRGNSGIKDQTWMELRDQAKQEFDFRFGAYYHTRDFLGDIDWDHAILYEMDGAKIMVFLFRTDYADQIDAKLMVKQGDNGQNIYMIRVRSTDSKGKYASIYTANDKVLHYGTIEGNAFKETGSTTVETNFIADTWPAACNRCHGGSSGGDGGWGDPVPGGGNIWGNNVLGDVVIQDQAIDWDWGDWNSYWGGPVIVIPGGGGDDAPTQTVDNDLVLLLML